MKDKDHKGKGMDLMERQCVDCMAEVGTRRKEQDSSLEREKPTAW